MALRMFGLLLIMMEKKEKMKKRKSTEKKPNHIFERTHADFPRISARVLNGDHEDRSALYREGCT